MGRRDTTPTRLSEPDLQLRVPLWRVLLGEVHTGFATLFTIDVVLALIGASRAGTVDVAALAGDAARSLALVVLVVLLFEIFGDARGRLTVVGKRLILGAIPRLTRKRVVRLDRIDLETRRWNDPLLALLGLRAVRQVGAPTRFVPWLWISRRELQDLVFDAQYLAERAPTAGAIAR